MDLTGCIEEIRALPFLSPMDRSRFSVAEQDKYAAFFEMYEVLSRLREVLPEVLEAAGEEAREPDLPAVPKAVQAPTKRVLGEEPESTARVFSNEVPDGENENEMLYWDDTNGIWTLLDAPDADYKVLQRKSDDTIGWDWVRAH